MGIRYCDSGFSFVFKKLVFHLSFLETIKIYEKSSYAFNFEKLSQYKNTKECNQSIYGGQRFDGFLSAKQTKRYLGAFFFSLPQPASQFTVHSTVPPGLTTICGAIKSDTSHKLHPAVSNRGAGIGNPAKSLSGPGI